MNLQLMGWNGETGIIATMLLVVLVLLLIVLIWVIVLAGKLSRLRKRLAKIIGNSSADNVDDLLLNIQTELERLNAMNQSQQKELADIRSDMRKMKSRVGIYRYNAFAQQGSDLSFSIAILDDEMDGVVLTGIHSREESYIYAKPVEKGRSSYTLSPEEKQVIDQTGNSAKRGS